MAVLPVVMRAEVKRSGRIIIIDDTKNELIATRQELVAELPVTGELLRGSLIERIELDFTRINPHAAFNPLRKVSASTAGFPDPLP
jgi:hypothetical protein